MIKKYHFATDNKASCSDPDSPCVTSASQPEKSQRRLWGFAIAVAALSIPILTLYKVPAAASAAQYNSRGKKPLDRPE
jgi:hypothetical protein